MMQWIGAAWMLVGALFMAIAALGVARLPDLFTRMQAATKTGAAGGGCILLGTAFFFSQIEVAAVALLVVAFLLLTAPVAAHLVARTAYLSGVPVHPLTKPDELREHLESQPRPGPVER